MEISKIGGLFTELSDEQSTAISGGWKIVYKPTPATIPTNFYGFPVPKLPDYPGLSTTPAYNFGPIEYESGDTAGIKVSDENGLQFFI
ncbi:MAG: hypothetical protein HC936_12270 [Leptolyngbyaceae cyanobacterium SU_3_3]|nr:hypothetical protein [Leptolyngbyaceae cyanobacterium SU_3_3]NJR48568.1 hypothetical protein [Leptolyngbyaceae cyanobacterium CSU_1_3]